MARKKTKYDVHPGVAMMQKWVDDLPAKTGRSIDQWSDEFKKLGKKFKQRQDLIDAAKREYSLGTNSCWHIWEYTFGKNTWEGDGKIYLKNAEEYVAGQYKGKEQFKPIFEAIVEYARTLGPDVRVCPCKTMVPLYRERVFAEMHAATKTRFELCLCLENVPHDDLLRKNPRAKGNDRQLHVIHMSNVKDFTPAVKTWLQKAYEQNGKK